MDLLLGLFRHCCLGKDFYFFFSYWFHRSRIGVACPGLKSRQEH